MTASSDTNLAYDNMERTDNHDRKVRATLRNQAVSLIWQIRYG